MKFTDLAPYNPSQHRLENLDISAFPLVFGDGLDTVPLNSWKSTRNSPFSPTPQNTMPRVPAPVPFAETRSMAKEWDRPADQESATATRRTAAAFPC